MIANTRSIRISLVKENPLRLIFISLILFSLLVLFLIHSRSLLFPNEEKFVQRSVASIPTPSYLAVAIPALQKKIYTPVALTNEKIVSSNGLFTSKIISYTVDGYKEYALIDVPTAPKPVDGYPVLIISHGYIVPTQYDTVNSYIHIANFFAENGFIVIKPDYRGNGNSQGATDALQRYNYPVDVMTLLVSLQNIPQVNATQVYLWGHSMGGEVTLTVMEILGHQVALQKKVKAVVLWAPVTNPAKWFEQSNLRKIPEAMLTPFPYAKTFAILGQPSEASTIWQSINPLNYLSDITVPIQLNHGTSDPTVPYSWSIDLQNRLKANGKTIDFISYLGSDHNLVPNTSQALQNNLQFFRANQ